jgi:hypothetical protein
LDEQGRPVVAASLPLPSRPGKEAPTSNSPALTVRIGTLEAPRNRTFAAIPLNVCYD